jgi:hypothetical protein
MPDLSMLPTVILMLSILAAFLGTLGAGAIAIARWARRTGRRPWVWVLGAYAALNVLVAVIEALIGRGAR